MANLYTGSCIGIRRDAKSSDLTGASFGANQRCFEPKGGCLYRSNRVNLEYKGTLYQVGDNIPYDESSVYTDDALMERYFNSGWVLPEA